jgi:hypothetical protein
MKRNLFIVLAVAAAVFFGSEAANAQFTITIPRIPKIKKDKPQAATQSEPATAANTSTITPDAAETKPATAATAEPKSSWWVDYHVEELAKFKKKLDEWVPADSYFPSPVSNDDYAVLALSPTERTAWLKDHKALDVRDTPNNKLDAAFDSLKESLIRRIPDNKVDPKAFAFHNLGEEKMIVTDMSSVSGIKVYKTGLSEANWLIDKNDYGLPTARYKHGMLWGRNPNAEDQFCRIWYVNIIQDYSGGGTYGASYAKYTGKELVACPAGK